MIIINFFFIRLSLKRKISRHAAQILFDVQVNEIIFLSYSLETSDISSLIVNNQTFICQFDLHFQLNPNVCKSNSYVRTMNNKIFRLRVTQTDKVYNKIRHKLIRLRCQPFLLWECSGQAEHWPHDFHKCLLIVKSNCLVHCLLFFISNVSQGEYTNYSTGRWRLKFHRINTLSTMLTLNALHCFDSIYFMSLFIDVVSIQSYQYTNRIRW